MQTECIQCGYIGDDSDFGPDKECPVCLYKNNYRISIMESPSTQEENDSKETKELILVEARSDFGITEFFQTFLNLIRFPAAFFKQITSYSGILRPFAIAYCINWLVVGFLLLTTGLDRFSIGPVVEKFPEMEIIVTSPYFLFLLFIISPIFIMIANFVIALLFHLILKITFLANENFIQTFRLFLYLSFLELFKVVPFIGGMITGFLGFVFLILGIKTIHRLTWVQTIIYFLIIGALFIFGALGINIMARQVMQYLV